MSIFKSYNNILTKKRTFTSTLNSTKQNHIRCLHYCFHIKLMFQLIVHFVIISSFFVGCHGSHYVKYHMDHYCDSTQKHIIHLEPNSNMTAIMLKLKRESYKPNMNCSVYLDVPPGYGMMAFIPKMKMRRYSSKADHIEFFANGRSLIKFYGNNQEVVSQKTILTNVENSVMMVRFVSESYYYSLPGKGFKIVVNLYTLINQNNECDANLGLNINCQNQFCIDSLLECDGIDNCRNDFDEMRCDENNETKLSLYIFIGTLLVMFLLVIIFMMKTKDRQKEIVRKMSQAYANNHPILYVMENNGSDSPTESSCTDVNDEPNLVNLGHRESDQQKFLRPSPSFTPGIISIRSKLSLSLPHGMERLHNNGYA